ncbi:MAG: hypothetical protein QM802_20660 [Agriterribacter sp.]
MAALKRRTLQLSTGKQIKLFGNSLAINSALEIGEGAAPNIFSFFEEQGVEDSSTDPTKDTTDVKTPKPKVMKKPSAVVSNPHRLTRQELEEIADYNIRLWMDLKDKLRAHPINDINIFNREALK